MDSFKEELLALKENKKDEEKTNYSKSISKNLYQNDAPLNASKAFEILLFNCGDYHLYQWKLTLIVGYLGIFGTMQFLSAVFLAATPEHFCNVPYLNNTNLTYLKTIINSTVPWVRGKEGYLEPSKCQYYDYEFLAIRNFSFSPENDFNLSKSEMKDCESWIFSDKSYKSTIVTEWDLVCDRKWLMSTTQSTYMMGMLFGSIIFSPLSDKIGRRPTLLISGCLFILTSISVAFANSFALFLILRFVVAGTGYALGLVSYVLLMETVSIKGRSVMGTFSEVFFIFGFISLSPLAYFIRDWRTLQLVISIPSVTILLCFWILPESSRWLLMQGREEEGIKILETIANTNGKPFPVKDELESFLKIIRKEVQNQDNNATVIRKIKSIFSMVAVLVRTPNMRRRNLIVFYTWFVTSMTYYGLTFSGVNLNVSLYLSVAISALVELPALITQILTLLIFGRRTVYCTSFIVGGVSCLAIMFVPTKMVGLNLALSTLGKFSISIAFGVSYIISAELVPTNVRNSAMGIASVSARIGSGLAPYFVDLLGDVYYAIPFIIFGALAVLAGILALLLPETGKKCLPESVEEIESMPR